MARNIGPTAAGTQLGVALTAARMPQVFDLFATGVISEATVRAVSNEVDSLSIDDVIVADAELAPKLPGMTTVQARHAAARVVIGIDAEAAHMRAAENRADARVSMFPDKDGVAHLHVRGPAEQILAAYQALDSWAVGLRAAGDPRTRGQIMCQTLVERVTGLQHADACDLEVQLVLDAKTLLAGGDTPVELDGYGPHRTRCGRRDHRPRPERVDPPAVDRPGRRHLAGPRTATAPVRPPHLGAHPHPRPVAVANPGAIWRSATTTTSRTTGSADRPSPTTAKGCAPDPTPSSTNPAGRSPPPARPPSGAPPPATNTAPTRRRCCPGTSANNRHPRHACPPHPVVKPTVDAPAPWAAPPLSAPPPRRLNLSILGSVGIYAWN